MVLGVMGFVERDFLASGAGLMGAIAIIGILSDGGLHMDLKHVVKEGYLGTLLMMAGLITTPIGIGALLTLAGFPLATAMLVGIMLAGTSSSVVIPIVTGLSFVSEKLKTILSIESISDTFSIVLALFLIHFLEFQQVTDGAASVLVQGVVLQFLSAISVGLIFGSVWGPFIARLKQYEYSYAATLGALILLYAFSELFGSSGAIAVFTAGIMLANAHWVYHALFPEFQFERLDEDIGRTHGLFAFLIRVFFFVFLGMIVGVPETQYLVIGLFITGVIVLARYIYVSFFVKRNIITLTTKEQKITYIMIPRGLSAAVLSIFAYSSGLAYGYEILQIVFSVIIFSIIVSTVGSYVLQEKKENKTKKETPRALPVTQTID